MPARFLNRLTLLESDAAGPPQHTGPAVHAACLRALAVVDPDLASDLHDGANSKWALTPVLSTEDTGCWFEVGVLADDLVPAFTSALSDLHVLQIGRTCWRVEETATVVQPYSELLAASRPRTSWTVRFLTPTMFRTSKGMGVRRSLPLPGPRTTFNSLLRRWERLAPVSLPSGTTIAIRDHLAIEAYALRTAPHLTKAPDIFERGFVGEVRYRAVRADLLEKEALDGIGALVSFAAFGGIGDQTAKGMGCIRPTDS